MRLARHWIVAEPDPAMVLAVASALGVGEPVARVLVGRGLETPAAALAFLDAEMELLENPFRMAGMEKAVDRLRIARTRNERVFVAGDRDVDGVTSTALMVTLLEAMKIASAWKVPTPADGYGLSRAAIDAAVSSGSSLLIAVDCGIRDFDGVNYAREKKVDVVILDHHEPAETLPEAHAIVDPKRGDCPYPFRELSACGVVFKFAQAFLIAEDGDFYKREFVVLDCETSGTSAGSHDILEVAALKCVNGVETDRFESLVRPTRPVPAAMTEIHGLAEKDLVDAPEGAEVMAKLHAFIGKAVIVGHRVSFDVGFIKAAVKPLGLSLPNETYDTLSEARSEFPGRSHRLEDLSTWLGIAHDEKHHAMSDVEATFALFKRLVARRNPRLQSFLRAQFDLVGLSTIADVVPLTDENRVLVKRGIEAFASSDRPGIVALRKALLRSGDRTTAKNLAWSVVPVINAAGRMGRAEVAVKLLLARNDAEARPLTAELSALNVERKERVKTNVAAANEAIARDFDPERDAAAVVVVGEIEHGVTGIVASRLVEDVGRPVVLLIDDGSDLLAGTARSIKDFDITAAFGEIAEIIARYGGHGGAAGLSIRKDRLVEFRERFNAIVRREVSPERLVPILRIDAVIRPEEIAEGLMKDLERLEPTGHGNTIPVFCLRGATVVEARRMGDHDQHVKITVEGGRNRIEAVKWNVAAAELPKPGSRIDLAFTLEENSWQGRKRIQCLIEDFRESAA
jgi:single-stranded-DNA-specific exonuclease